jgi:hypothetical protein
LEEAADAMQRLPLLSPDAALRLVVWGAADAAYPGDGRPGAAEFDEAHSAIEVALGWQGHGIDHVSSAEAIPAARREAARLRSYGGGSS